MPSRWSLVLRAGRAPAGSEPGEELRPKVGGHPAQPAGAGAHGHWDNGCPHKSVLLRSLDLRTFERRIG